MRRKILFNVFSVILVWLSLIAMAMAQEPFNISCINQYEYNWHGGLVGVEVQGDYAYLGFRNEGMRIINISEPGNYYEVAHLEDPNISDYAVVAVSGSYAYVGYTRSELSIIDISTKTAPAAVASIPIDGSVNNIRIFDNRLYLCTSDSILVVDITNPSSPVIITVFGPREAMDVFIQGNKAYVAACDDGFKVYDIADIEAPVYINGYDPGYEFVAMGVALYGNYAVMAFGWQGFQVVDLATMQAVSGIDSLNFAMHVKVSGNYAYLAYGYPECPLAIIDISNPVEPSLVSVYYPPEDISNMVVHDDMVYVADNTHGLRVVDATDRANPVEIVRYNRYGYEKGVKIVDNLAYAQSNFRLTAMNIGNPLSPIELGDFECAYEISDFEIDGEIAYVMTGEPTELFSVDFSNPSNPVLLDRAVPSDYYNYYQMTLYENYLIVLGWNSLKFYDIADPTQIEYVGEYSINTDGFHFYMFDHYLLVCSDSNDLVLLDLENLLEPNIVYTYEFSGFCYDICVSGNTLYLLNGNTFRVIDITDLNSWELLSTNQLDDEGFVSAYKCAVEDGMLYLAMGYFGISIYDVSTPASPYIAGSYDTPGNANSIAVDNRVAVVADRTNLGFYDCSATGIGDNGSSPILPLAIKLLSNYPNPFNASTIIRFETSDRTNIAIDILDILGRKITNLANREFEAGEHEIIWHGQDQAGITVSSGRYYIRASGNGDTHSLPVTLLK